MYRLQLLDHVDRGLLGLLQAGQHGPHGRHLQRVRRNMGVADARRIEVALVDAHLVLETGDVGYVDLHRAIAQRLHELVALQLAVLRLVGVPDDHLVDVGLRELLGLDLVLLRRPQQVVQEGHIQLEHLDELDDAPVGHVELSVEIERARVGVRAVLGDLAVVDVAGQLGGILVLLVLGLEGTDADTILFRQHQAAHLHVPHHLGPVAVIAPHEFVELESARRAQLALHRHPEGTVGQLFVYLPQNLFAQRIRDEVQRLLVHGAVDVALAFRGLVAPPEGVQRALGRAGVVLDPLLEQAHHGALGAAHRPVQQQDALLRAVALRRRLEDVDHLHQRLLEPVDGVGALVLDIVEELVAQCLALVLGVLLHTVRHDHVVHALERRARDARATHDQLEIVVEGPRPVQLLKLFDVLPGPNEGNDVVGGAHESSCSRSGGVN